MSDMLTQIRSLGGQLRWASEAQLPVVPAATDVFIAGMGGSGIAGDFVAALASAGHGRVAVHKGYGPLPGWALDRKPLLIAISFSGNTEETLDIVHAATNTDLPIVILTTGGELSRITGEQGWPTISVPGGIQPRAAVGYLFGAVARVVAAAGLIPDQGSALNEAADAADQATGEGSPRWQLASGIAQRLAGRIPIIYGGGPISGAVAQRWKTQINENAKLPAFAAELPEADHNEIVGWESAPSLSSFLAVFLEDSDQHPRVRQRIELTARLIEPQAAGTVRLESRGATRLERVLSLVMLGDLVSIYMAVLRGVDPCRVEMIERLKDELRALPIS
jgi:glucose/mannose-6-phosphate isomerase